MERETGLEVRIPISAFSLPPEYADILSRCLRALGGDEVHGRVEEEATAEAEAPVLLPRLDQELMALAGPAYLRDAINIVLDGASSSHDRRRRRWGMRLLLEWARDAGEDVALLDAVHLRSRYRPHLLGRFGSASVQMWVAHRLLEVVDDLRRAGREGVPALPGNPRQEPLFKPRTRLLRDLPPGSVLDEAVMTVVSEAPSRISTKVRRAALARVLAWCHATGRDPELLTFEEIDGALLPAMKHEIRNWTEVGVHARKLVRRIADVQEARRAEVPTRGREK